VPAIHFIGPRDANGYPLQFHEGIPARDLESEEYAALSDEQREIVRNSGLYDYANLREARKAERTQQDEPTPATGEPAAAEPAPTEAPQDTAVEQVPDTKKGGSR
jgi:hypothetical protein